MLDLTSVLEQGRGQEKIPPVSLTEFLLQELFRDVYVKPQAFNLKLILSDV